MCRKVWAYAMKNKSNVFDIFKVFYALVEKEIGKPLKCHRIVNCGEYCFLTFRVYINLFSFTLA